MNQQEWQFQQQVLQKLTVEQVEQALHSLYSHEEPKDPLLQRLQIPEWLVLMKLLNDLLLEKSQSSLH